MHSRESDIGGSESLPELRGLLTSRAARPAAHAGLTWRGSPPRFHESLWGVFSKLAYLNALSRRERRELLGVEQDGGINVNRLRSWVPSPNHSRGAWSLQCVEPFVSAPGEPSNFERLRFCKRCLEGGFHSVIFQMPEVSKCAAHDTLLHECCPHCDRPIRYNVWRPSPHIPKPFECTCGQLIWRDRDTVSRWYSADSKLSQLDQFVECLLDIQSSSKSTSLRIGTPSIKITSSSSLAERLGSLSPSKWVKMPRKYHRYVRVDVAMWEARRNLLRSGASTSRNIAMDEWCATLMEHAEHSSKMILTKHKTCIKKAVRDFEREGFRAFPTTCGIANAFVFWKAYWVQPRNRRWLADLLDWHVFATIAALSEEGVPEGIESAMRAGRQGGAPAWTHRWPELWDFLGEQVLFGSLYYFASQVPRGLIVFCSFTDKHISLPASPWGSVWLLTTPKRPDILELRYRAEEDLRDLNRQPCWAAVTASPDLQTAGV